MWRNSPFCSIYRAGCLGQGFYINVCGLDGDSQLKRNQTPPQTSTLNSIINKNKTWFCAVCIRRSMLVMAVLKCSVPACNWVLVWSWSWSGGDGDGDPDDVGGDDDDNLVVAVEASRQGRAANQGEEGEAAPDWHRHDYHLDGCGWRHLEFASED